MTKEQRIEIVKSIKSELSKSKYQIDNLVKNVNVLNRLIKGDKNEK